MTKSQKLTKELNKIYNAKKDEIDALPKTGPNGGQNAMYIDGWSCPSGIGTLTKAANNSLMPVLNWWSGNLPTPSSSLPLCVHDDCVEAYNKIFKNDDSQQFCTGDLDTTCEDCQDCAKN